jgi:hypothetical protein
MVAVLGPYEALPYYIYTYIQHCQLIFITTLKHTCHYNYYLFSVKKIAFYQGMASLAFLPKVGLCDLLPVCVSLYVHPINF